MATAVRSGNGPGASRIQSKALQLVSMRSSTEARTFCRTSGSPAIIPSTRRTQNQHLCEASTAFDRWLMLQAEGTALRLAALRLRSVAGSARKAVKAAFVWCCFTQVILSEALRPLEVGVSNKPLTSGSESPQAGRGRCRANGTRVPRVPKHPIQASA